MADRKTRERRKIQYTDAQQRTEKHNQGYEESFLNLPEGVKKFKFREDRVYHLDVLPYIVGKGNPMAKPGTAHFERTYFVHRNVGPDNKIIVCPLKTFNKKCPICEYVGKLRTNPKADKKLIQDLRPKERQLFAIIDVTDPESREEGIQVYETSHYKGFGQMLDKRITKDPDNLRNFHSLTEGKTVKVEAEEDSYNNNTYYKPATVRLIPRKKQYNEDLIDEVPCLDEIPKEMSYDDLRKLFYQEEAPKKKGSKDEDEDDVNATEVEDRDDEDEEEEEEDSDDDEEEVEETDDDEESEEEDEEAVTTAKDKGIKVGTKVKYRKKTCEVVHVSGDGTKLRLKDDDDTIFRSVAVDDVTVVKGGKKPKDDEEEWDEEEDSDPAGGDMEDEEEEESEDEDEDEEAFTDDEEEDSNDDDEDEDSDDEEEEEEKPKRGRPRKKPVRRGK